jgi:hypothetical protein
MLRHQLGMLPEPIAGSFDLHDDGMVKQSVEQRRRDDGISNISPHFAKPRFDVRIIAPRSYRALTS